MDEVMLSALLFLACAVLARGHWSVPVGITAALTLIYAILLGRGLEEHMSGYYLGGYAAAPFYLPVMLVGLYIGRQSLQGRYLHRNNLRLIVLVAALLPFTLLVAPAEKLTATPAFMALSLLICYALLLLVERSIIHINLKEVEYLGRKPLRYWVMMYLLCIVPSKVYVDMGNQRLMVPWTMAVTLSVAVMILLWLISKVWDAKVWEKVTRTP